MSEADVSGKKIFRTIVAPIVVSVAMLIVTQTCVLVYWIGTTSQRVYHVEKQIENIQGRVHTLEVKR